MQTQFSEAELSDLLGAGYRYACALRVDPADAEDLVQDAWIKVVRAYGNRPTRAVLLQSIRNLYIDQYRHAQKFQHVSYDDSASGLIDTDAELAVMNVGDPQLNRCLLRLRDTEREVLFLTVVEGYTAEEVGRLTGSPRGTVLSLMHRARMKLRNYLMDDESQYGSVTQLKGRS